MTKGRKYIHNTTSACPTTKGNVKFPFFISQFFLVSFSQTFLVLSMYYTLPTSLSLKYFSFFPVSHTTRLSLSQICFVLFLYYALTTSLSRRSFSFFSCITYYQPVFLSNLSRPFLVLHTTHLSFSRMFLVLSVYYTLPNSLSLKSFSFFSCIAHHPPVFVSDLSRSFPALRTTHLSFSQIFLVLFLYYTLPTCLSLSLKSFSFFSMYYTLPTSLSLKSFSFFLFITH